MPTPYTINFDDLFTSTLYNFAEKMLADNITSGSPVLRRLQEKGMIRPAPQTGPFIPVRVFYALNPNTGWFAPYEEVPVAPDQNTTTAIYNYRKAVASVVVAGEEERANQGRVAVANLIQDKLEITQTTLRERISEALFATTPAPNAIESLPYLIDNTTVVGRINPATDTWWRSYVDSTSGTINWALITKLITKTTFGNERPDLIIVHPDLWDSLHGQLVQQQRFVNETQGEGGFVAMLWQGIPVYFDSLMPSGMVLAINSNYLRLYHRSKPLFQPTPMRYIERQDVHLATLLFEGNLTTNARRYHGKLTNKTP